MKKRIKVLLINPPSDNCTVTTTSWNTTPEDIGSFPPISLMYLAGALKLFSNHEVSILDAVFDGLDITAIRSRIFDYKPDLVGITCFTSIFYDCMQVAKAVKSVNPKIHVTFGGAHTRVFPDETIAKPEIDSLVLGEGEYILPCLADAIAENKPLDSVPGLIIKSKEGFIKTGEPGYIENIDGLPFPDFTLLPFKKYFSAIGTGNPVGAICSSRGCPHSCTFCCKPYRTYRMRSAENVVDEIKQYYRHGIKEFFFFDDMFNINAERVIDIAEHILKNNLRITWSFRGRVDAVSEEMLKTAKRAGCIQILFGVETCTEEGLKEIKKRITIDEARRAVSLCRKVGIESSTNWIIGFPHDRGKEDVERLIQFSCALDSDYAQFNVLIPYQGTEVFEQGVRQGVLNKDFWRDYVKNPSPRALVPIWDEFMSREDLSIYIRKCYRSFYFRPRKIIQNIFRVKSWQHFISKLRGFIILLGFGGYKRRNAK